MGSKIKRTPFQFCNDSKRIAEKEIGSDENKKCAEKIKFLLEMDKAA